MNENPKLVFVTDLDGTLLDHHSYQWQAAAPALQALRKAGIPLVLNSSKTRSEISALRGELHNNHPFIVENGAAVVVPADYFEPGPEHLMPFAAPREEILEVLERLREEAHPFLNFEAMSAAELARISGLSEAAAANAKRRDATEPLLWQGDQTGLTAFTDALAEYQLQLVRGGRFFHVMGFFDKAEAMQYLLERYRALYAGPVRSVALGDSPNDLKMLQQADIAVVIKGVNSDNLKLSGDRTVIYSQEAGPAGWNGCVLDILARHIHGSE